ncbi:hypothetical protein [Fortiea contorta]|nr:hypothetical protein [Fortiea contorta]
MWKTATPYIYLPLKISGDDYVVSTLDLTADLFNHLNFGDG